jgi:hypothetical protein
LGRTDASPLTVGIVKVVSWSWRRTRRTDARRRCILLRRGARVSHFPSHADVHSCLSLEPTELERFDTGTTAIHGYTFGTIFSIVPSGSTGLPRPARTARPRRAPSGHRRLQERISMCSIFESEQQHVRRGPFSRSTRFCSMWAKLDAPMMTASPCSRLSRL